MRAPLSLPHRPAAQLIAVVGATGPEREWLARALHRALSDEIGTVGRVDDAAGIDTSPPSGRANETASTEPWPQRLAEAMQQHTVVVAGINALIVDADHGISPRSTRWPRIPIDLCLLAAPLPAGQPSDDGLRLALLQSGTPFSVIAGPPETRLQAALSAWHALQRARRAESIPPTRWRHVCGRCGDGDCERQMFDQLHTPR